MELHKVFLFWIEQILKVFDLMKHIPIYKGVSMYHTFIFFLLLSVLVSIVRFGIRFQNLVRWSDNTLRYYDEDNPRGFNSYGKYRR